MNQSDIDYYRARMDEEQEAAERAASDVAAETHRRLAQQYERLVNLGLSSPR